MIEHVGQPSMIPVHDRSGVVVAYALVDATDVTLVNQHKWSLNKGYAIYSYRDNGKLRVVRMHRLILGLALTEELEGDHYNRQRLDNRRCNLRIVTHAQNMQNRRLHRNSRSGYRGVQWDSSKGKWRVCVRADGRKHSFGYFDDASVAAQVASDARRQLLPYSLEGTAA